MKHEIRVLGALGSEIERVVLRERRQRFARPRWRPLVAIIALCLGGATGALAAAGVFRAGAPVGANVPPTPHVLDGVAVRGTAHLLPLAVNDPQGGPPWGLRIERTTRGLTCLQYGRLDHGTIGALGVDDAFSNDGDFHAFPVNYAQDAGLACATTDAHDNAFVSATLEAAAASGIEYSCHGVAASLFANLRQADGRNVSNTYQAIAERDPGPVCPPSNLRNIYYGLLGPDAVSITYPSPNGQLIKEKTAGADGAYLVLGPPTGAICDPEGCGNGDSGGPGLSPGFITSVTYRHGYVCRIAELGALHASAVAGYLAALDKRFPVLVQARKERGHVTRQTIAALLALRKTAAYRAILAAHRGLFRDTPTCPLRGYVAPRTARVTTAEVAAPISVKIGQTTRVCGRGPNRRRRCSRRVPVIVTFTARVAVTNIASHYEINMKFAPSGPCTEPAGGGDSASTNGDIRAGQIVRQRDTESACPGTYHGNVVYAANTGPSSNSTVPGLPGQGAGVLVGTFSFHTP